MITATFSVYNKKDESLYVGSDHFNPYQTRTFDWTEIPSLYIDAQRKEFVSINVLKYSDSFGKYSIEYEATQDGAQIIPLGVRPLAATVFLNGLRQNDDMLFQVINEDMIVVLGAGIVAGDIITVVYS